MPPNLKIIKTIAACFGSLSSSAEKAVQMVRAPVKNFQGCVQNKRERGWKADKMCVQSKIFGFGNVTILMWLSKWVQNSAVLPSLWRKVSPGFKSFCQKKYTHSSCNNTFNNSLLLILIRRGYIIITPRISRKLGQISILIITAIFDRYHWLLRTNRHEIKMNDEFMTSWFESLTRPDVKG